jgi:hypothetical protein
MKINGSPEPTSFSEVGLYPDVSRQGDVFRRKKWIVCSLLFTPPNNWAIELDQNRQRRKSRM